MKKILAAALLSVAAAPAFAADTGFYVGVDVGRSSTGGIAGVALSQSTDTVGGVLAGYQVNKNFAVEAFFTGAGKFAGTGGGRAITGKADVWGADAVGLLPLSDAFSLYGKLGYASTKTSASSVPAGLADATRNAVTYGVGAQYNVTPAIGVRLGWDH